MNLIYRLLRYYKFMKLKKLKTNTTFNKEQDRSIVDKKIEKIVNVNSIKAINNNDFKEEQGFHETLRKSNNYIIKTNFREFNDKEAKEWAYRRYKDIHIDKNVEEAIYNYCKQDEPRANYVLRNNEKDNEIMKEIKLLNEFLTKYSLNENIVVFRLLNFNPFENGISFTEKGFMSTSLVKKDILLSHETDYRLKIYLPEGTKGFYVNFISSRIDEQEFLLPKEVTINYLNEYKSGDKLEIECYVSVEK